MARSEADTAAAKASEARSKIKIYTESDSRRNGWPALDDDILFDPLRGHWDLWGKTEELDGKRLIGRNPAQDIEKNAVVCIDFGTSSTVVARRLDGKNRLVRVGVSDWAAAPKALDFENPTCLEFIDFGRMQKAWNGEHFRPEVSWSDLKCAHQAKGDVAPQASQAQINSIIQDLKSWAFSGKSLDLVDQQGASFSVAQDSGEAAINPIALYAWHLGLALNNQYSGKGRIYCRYYLSFPATFDEATRKLILDAFRQGLERSIPPSLGGQELWQTQNFFDVRPGVDEPVAYAASALEDIEPEENEKIAFGVFDFGGGTTDFAFGQYRLASSQEEEQGIDYVLELIDVAGVPDLGGEKLLHVLAHDVICRNLADVVAKKLPFTAAPGEDEPAGSEHVFSDGMIARTNTMRLIEQLRPFWEGRPEELDPQDEGIIKLAFKSAENPDPVMLDLKIDKNIMLELLRKRIGKGVESFFTAFRQAFRYHGLEPKTLHILPAGNSCRSPLVKELFEKRIESYATEDNIDPQIFKLHELLLPDENNPEAPTLKTGVALGQLKAVPGMGLGIIRLAPKAGEALAAAFGKFRRGKLQPLLNRFSKLNQWVAFGPVRDDLVLRAGWSENPDAIENRMTSSDSACHELPIEFAEKDRGRQIFVRPMGSASVEIALGDDLESIDKGSIRRIELEI